MDREVLESRQKTLRLKKVFGYLLFVPAAGLMLFFAEGLPNIKIIVAGASLTLSAISGLLVGASISHKAMVEVALEKIDWEDEG